MSKNKKFTDSRLREIALMASKGLPADLIADVTGLPRKSVANLCWIYKWPPEKLDEMTERVKLSGKIGGYARVDLRKYFIMHPEQRPAPHLQLFSEDQKEAVEVCQSEPPETMREADRDFDGDFKRALCQKVDAEKPPYLKEWPIERRVTRLEDLANCFRCEFNQLKIARDNHEERLSANHKRIEAFQRFVDEMPVLPAAKLESTIGSLVAEMAAKDHQIDKLQDELTAQRRTLGLLSARVEEMRKHCKMQENLENAFDRRIFRLEHEPIKREEKIGLLEEKLGKLNAAFSELWQCIEEQHDCFESFSTSTIERMNAQEEQIAFIFNHVQMR